SSARTWLPQAMHPNCAGNGHSRSPSSTKRRELSHSDSEPVFTRVDAGSAGVLKQEILMKTIAIAAAVGALALAWASPQAQARTCVQKSVTGPAGHHTMMKCTTARHHAFRGAHRTVTRTTRTVVTDDYITTTAPSRRVSR